MLGIRRTLEIIERTLREVVNRVRLCGHYAQPAGRDGLVGALNGTILVD